MRFPLGQPVTIPITVQQRNVDGTYSPVNAGALSVTVQVASDDGTWTVTGTYPSPVNDSTGSYHQDIPAADLTIPGHYLWVATSTGTGAGTASGEFDVFDPLAPQSRPTLADPDDVAARLGRDLTDAETLRLGALLADASAQIRRYCRRDFLLHTDETVILYGHDSEILLPGYPVQSVSSVTAIGGGMGLPDVPIPWFTFDGVRTIRISPGYGAILNLPEAWWAEDYPGTYRVVYSWGPLSVPDEVVMVAANAALGVLTAPTAAAGVISEQIGPYSYRLEAGGGGVAVSLSQADLAILKDFRNTAATVQTRLR